MERWRRWMCHGTLAFAFSLPLSAQDLEPRALSNVPVGMNFLLVGYGYVSGNVLLDPAIPIEGLDSRINTILGAYVRTIDVFGMSGKVDVIVPVAGGDWVGFLEGEERSRVATGAGDPRLRLSVNFLGAPALRAGEFGGYEQGTVAGASIQVGVPVGQYDPERLLNLGSNRWFFKPQVGVSHTVGPWAFEAYVSTWFYTANTDFFGGLELEQRPIWAFKTHVVRSLPRGMWVAADIGYAAGGRARVDGTLRERQLSTARFGATLAVPLSETHALKFTAATATTHDLGPDFDAFGVTYQYRWGGS